MGSGRVETLQKSTLLLKSSGTPSTLRFCPREFNDKKIPCKNTVLVDNLVGPVGIEPTTAGLRVHCSAN